MMTDFYYLHISDAATQLLAHIYAETITEADREVASRKIKATTTAIGGRLEFRQVGGTTHVLSRNRAGFPTDTMTIPLPLVNKGSLFAGSLESALEIHQRAIDAVRYNPEIVILWVTPAGSQIVKAFDVRNKNKAVPQRNA